MQGNNQQAYDRGTSLFSPDGRIYQVEYAREAVKRGAPSLGLRTAEGVVLVAQSRAGSELMEAESIEKLHKLDDHVGAASAGHVADARKLIDFAREQAQRNRLRYDEPIGVETLAKRITDNLQETTQRGGIRPFGAALLVGGVEDGEPRLFESDPSGTPHEWQATAIGGNRGDLLEFLEAEYRPDLSLDEGVTLSLQALLQVVDELSAADVSVATIHVDDGYHDLSTEEKVSALERARAEE
jgi:proteasome alpha subunit